MAIYDMASAIQPVDIVGSYQQGLTFGNALTEMRRKREQEVKAEEVRNGLAQFYRLGRPEQRTAMTGPDLLSMASAGAAGHAMLPNSPLPSALSPMARLGNDGFNRVNGAPMMVRPQEMVTPATPSSFDYQGAADYLASNGQFDKVGALADLRKLTQPQGLEWTGVIKDAEDAQGNPVLIGMTNQGPRPIEGYRAKPDAPKPPQRNSYKDPQGREVTQQWNSTTGRYDTIATGPAPVVKPEKPDTLSLEERAKIEQSYRKEFSGLNAAYGEIKRSRGNILSSLGQNTAAGDLAAATSLMKMLDPGSVVRESELAMAQNATGALDRVYNYAQKLASGQVLNPQQRAEYISLANDLFNNSDAEYKTRVGEFVRIAGDYGLKPENIVGQAAMSGPKLGDKKGGYVYIGGDPAQAKSWRPAQ